MEVIIACGLADPKGAWGAFLVKGLYDMRLFLHVAVYKGESLEELVRWALKGIEVLPLPESEVDKCEKMLLQSKATIGGDQFLATYVIDNATKYLRKYCQERGHGDAKKQFTIIVHRYAMPLLKQALQRNNVNLANSCILSILHPCTIWSYDNDYNSLRTEFFDKYKP